MNSINFDLTCPSILNVTDKTSEYGSANSSYECQVPDGGIGLYDVNGGIINSSNFWAISLYQYICQ